MRTSFLKSVRNAFLTGVVVLAPLTVTILVFEWLVGAIGGRFKDTVILFLARFIDVPLLSDPGLQLFWNVVATVLVLVMVTVLGYLSGYVGGRFLLGQAERAVQRVPLASAVYSTVKQIVSAFSAKRRASFERVVLVPFPRPGCYVIGLLTGKAPAETRDRIGRELWNVFVPTTPNPTSGFLILFPREEIVELDMSIGDAMKMLISGGAITPGATVAAPFAAAVAAAADEAVAPAPGQPPPAQPPA